MQKVSVSGQKSYKKHPKQDRILQYSIMGKREEVTKITYYSGLFRHVINYLEMVG